MTDKSTDQNYQSNKIGMFAVGCVSYLITQSGHVWRELPGFDIGIDGEIEVLPTNGMPGTKILVQVKGYSKPNKDSIKVSRAQSHWEYWRTQRNPVLVCEIEIEAGTPFPEPFKAKKVRWVDVSRAPVDYLKSISSIPFDKDFGIEFDFAESASKFRCWRKFIDQVILEWPRKRIKGVLDYGELIVHSGKPKDALQLINSIEQAVVAVATEKEQGQLFALELKAKRHGLRPAEVRIALEDVVRRSKKPCSEESIMELGYWYVVAALDCDADVATRVDLANKALEYFQKLDGDTNFNRMVRADYMLYAAMVSHMCENWKNKNVNMWKGKARAEHRNLKCAIEQWESTPLPKINREQRIKESETKRNLWRSHLLARDVPRIRDDDVKRWQEFREHSASDFITAQDYQDGILLKAWSQLVLSDCTGLPEQLSGAKSLLDAAIVGIRGCLPYPELDFWVVWIEDSYRMLITGSRSS